MTAAARKTVRLACALALGGGCGAPGAAPDDVIVLGSLAVSEEIPAGATVEIAPGAQLTAAADVILTVRGRLRLAAAAGPRARIAPAVAGQTWGGIIVESGGTLEVHGLELDGATTALDVKEGNARALFDDGRITNVESPFEIARGASLEVTKTVVVAAGSSSGISGAFKASRLDYQKSGATGGLIMGDANATFDVEDSVFRGTADAGGDYIISYGAKLVRVAYSTITGAHCAFHFNDVARFEIDHVTAGAETPTGPGNLNDWGAMLYGSGAGPHVIRDSNFVNSDLNLELLGVNGPITITNTFSTGKNEPADAASTGAWSWPAAEQAAAPVPDARPR